ncbi:phage tail tape measure protein [Polaromonas sp. UC242_47]|uniref:phage tail tape measure protein n=1 Tax=Polaromonas sp. UC242_47 TaxID=3374626 RepID=UPI00379B947E
MKLDTAYLRFLNNTGTERQIGYMQRLARSVDHAHARMERLGATAVKLGKAGAAGFAGYQAAKAVLAEPLKIERTYERSLADAANIAFPYGSRKQGMAAMNKQIESAVSSGGGTRDSALKAMNDLYAANIDKDVVESVLPHMQKYATSGNADPANIAQLVIYGLRSLKLDAKDIPLMLDKTLQSTKGGSMEFDSLAKWMPQVGAAGSMAGLRGMKGYESMLAGVQTSRLTAGTKDEAGTNFKDLLSMINGHALMTAAKKLGISPSDAIAKHIAEGGDAITGIVGLADRVANSDPRYMALDNKLKAGGIARDKGGQPLYTPEQQEIMQQQAALFQGSALGKLFHNQQSMQALVALRNNRDYYKDQIAATGLAKGQIGGQDFETIAQTNDYKMQQKANSELFAQTSSTGGLNAVLGKFAEGTTALYQKYPEFAQYIEGAKLAVGGLAAAAGGAATALAVLGLLGAKNAGGLPGFGGPGGGLPRAGGSPGAFPCWRALRPQPGRAPGGSGRRNAQPGLDRLRAGVGQRTVYDKRRGHRHAQCG